MNALADKIYQSIRKIGILDLIPDKPYLKLMYRLKMGKPLDLKNPKTYTEKLQWIKLYNHNPKYHQMVNKSSVKDYITERIGPQYVIPTYGIWDKFDEIDFNSLPSSFVLKTVHDSGGVIICKDKQHFDKQYAKSVIEESQKRNYFKLYREWPYKGVNPRIIAEKLLDDGSGQALQDYKVMCFGGKPKLIEYHAGRFTENHTQDFYDSDWNHLAIQQQDAPKSDISVPKPPLLDEMLRLSSQLADGIPHVRVDWYMAENQLYFGELTFFDDSGFTPFQDSNDDLLLGSWIPVP